MKGPSAETSASRNARRIERALGLVSAAAVLAIMAFLVHEGLTGAQTLPDLHAGILPPGPDDAPGQLRFAIHNDGGRTATAVALSLVLRDAGGTAVAERRLTLDYLPGHSATTGAFALPEAAASLAPTLVVEGYLDP